MMRPEGTSSDEQTLWKIHEERVVDNTRRLDLRIAHVELPDGVHFEQYVLRMPKASIAVPIDESGDNVLMIWRHRFIMDRWTWELPGGYVDPGEDPAASAFREVEEETSWAAAENFPAGEISTTGRHCRLREHHLPSGRMSADRKNAGHQRGSKSRMDPTDVCHGEDLQGRDHRRGSTDRTASRSR